MKYKFKWYEILWIIVAGFYIGSNALMINISSWLIILVVTFVLGYISIRQQDKL